MPLRALTPSASFSGWFESGRDATRAPSAALADAPCAFCGIRSGKWQRPCHLDADPENDTSVNRVAACPLCALVRHLERPRIDEEAALVWLPEMSQPAVNTLLREIHIQLRALGEGLHAAACFRLDTRERRTLYHARAALAARAGDAASRLGTGAPSELGSALLRLSPAGQARSGALLGGLRLLPLGRLYEAGEDVYPAIVDAWLALAKPAGSPHASSPSAPAAAFRSVTPGSVLRRE